MIRADFDSHPLWSVLDAIEQQLTEIVDQNQADDLPAVERIRVQISYVRSFRAVASTRAAFFHPQMLSDVQSSWDVVNSNLANRLSYGSGSGYMPNAAEQAELGLIQMAPWPRAYGKGGEVTQMQTLFEELLEHQRKSIEALEKRHQELRDEVLSYSQQVEAKRDEATEGVRDAQMQLSVLESTIEDQKVLLSQAVDNASVAVSDLSKQNDRKFEAWTKEREAAFEEDFAPLRKSVSDRVESADSEYDELLGAKQKYLKLVGAIAADEVASQFEKEARWGRRTGTAAYIVGGVLLALAALPLIWLVFDHSGGSSNLDWAALAVRISIGVLAGSAATVAIRLGSRLINNANAIKRMELELRAIGPFLANVSEKPKVDDAFIELVGKAFGNTYADTKSTGGANDAVEDRTSVTALAQLFELFEKLRKAAGPPSSS